MRFAILLTALVFIASCGQAKENKGGNSDSAIAADCAKQTTVMVQNHIPLPNGASPDAVTQACIHGAQRYRREVTKPADHTVTPATNK